LLCEGDCIRLIVIVNECLLKPPIHVEKLLYVVAWLAKRAAQIAKVIWCRQVCQVLGLLLERRAASLTIHTAFVFEDIHWGRHYALAGLESELIRLELHALVICAVIVFLIALSSAAVLIHLCIISILLIVLKLELIEALIHQLVILR